VSDRVNRMSPVDDPTTRPAPPIVITKVPPRGAPDDEVRAWAEQFAARMIAAAGPKPERT